MVRYELMFFWNRSGKPDAKLTPENDGQWVKYEDYAALEAELYARNEDVALAQGHIDRLRAERDRLRAIRAFVANDGLAFSFQTMGQYRTEILRQFSAALEGGDE